MRLHDEGRKRLLKLMVIQGTSHRDLARVIGWSSHSYVGRIMRGKIKTVDPDAAARISHHFGVGVDDLFLVESSSGPRQSVARKAS